MAAGNQRDAQTALVAFHVAHVSPEAPVTEDAAVDPETAADLQHQTLVTPLPEDLTSVTAYHERRVAFAGATLRSLDFVLELPERKRALGTLLNAAIEVNAADGGVIALRVPGGEWEPAPAGLTTRLEGAGVHPARLVGVMMSTETPWRLYCFILVDGTIQSAWSHGADDDEEAKEVGETIAYEQEFERISGLTLDALASESVGSHLATRATTASARADDATLAISMTLREALSGHGWGALFATSPAKPDSGLRTRPPRTAD